MKERGHFSLSLLPSLLFSLSLNIFPPPFYPSCCFLPSLPPRPPSPSPSCVSSPLLFFSLLIRPLDCSKLLSASPWECVCVCLVGGGGLGGRSPF